MAQDPNDSKSQEPLNTAAYFEERRAKANIETLLRILNRKGGEPPRLGTLVLIFEF